MTNLLKYEKVMFFTEYSKICVNVCAKAQSLLN